jgi:hypothetical protein
MGDSSSQTQTRLTNPSCEDSTLEIRIHDEIETFVQQIESLAGSIQPLMVLLGATFQISHRRFSKFLEKNGNFLEDKEGVKTYALTPEFHAKANKLKKRINSAKESISILSKSYVVSLVSQYDFFLGRLLRCLFLLKPEILNVSERQLTFAQLIELGSTEKAREFIIEKEIETFLRKSHIDQFSWMENKFSIELRRDLPIWPTFVELTERRNLLVHCNGVVSNQYLQICRENKVGLEKDLKVGDSLEISPEYFFNAFRCIFEIGVKLGHVLWRKVRFDQIEEADVSLIEITYNLLEEGKYKLASILLDFACLTLKKHASDQTMRIMVINRAQAYRWRENQEECLSIISKEDWSASSNSFKLAVEVLQDNFEKAAQIMRQIGAQGEIRVRMTTEK